MERTGASPARHREASAEAGESLVICHLLAGTISLETNGKVEEGDFYA